MGTKSSSSTLTFVRGDGVSSPKTDTIVLTESRTGNELPNYRNVISSHGNATTALTAQRRSFAFVPGLSRYYQTLWGGQYYYPTSDTWQGLVFVQAPNHDLSEFPDLVSRARADAISHAYSKIRRLQTPFEGQLFLGELKETIALLKAPHKRSLELLKALRKNFDADRAKYGRKAVRADFKALSRSVANSWLEFRFGVLPLVSDIESIVKLASEKTNRKSLERFRAYGVAEQSSVDTVQNGPHTIQYTTSVKVENMIRIGVLMQHLEKYDTVSGRLVDAFDDLSSIPVTTWELIPWSFLVDYFVNIGDIIESASTALSSVSHVSNSLVLTAERKGEVLSSGYPYLISFQPSSYSSKYRSVTRDGTLAAIPPLVFKLPGSKIRYANIAALSTLKLFK